jgi:preprotein translocase subunit SecA
VLDTHWREHLAAMDHLRQGIHLRGYAQKNPKQEYKRESFELFSQMLESLKHQVVTMLSTVQIRAPEDVQAMEAQRRTATAKPLHFDHPDSQAVSALAEPAQALGVDGLPHDHAQHPGSPMGHAPHGHGLQDDLFPGHIAPPLRHGPKAGRNDPCPCGSGKKYKHCHGKLD